MQAMETVQWDYQTYPSDPWDIEGKEKRRWLTSRNSQPILSLLVHSIAARESPLQTNPAQIKQKV